MAAASVEPFRVGQSLSCGNGGYITKLRPDASVNPARADVSVMLEPFCCLPELASHAPDSPVQTAALKLWGFEDGDTAGREILFGGRG